MTRRSDPCWDLDGPEYEKPEPALNGMTVEEYHAETARIKQIIEFQMQGMRLILHALHGGGNYGREAYDDASRPSFSFFGLDSRGAKTKDDSAL